MKNVGAVLGAFLFFGALAWAINTALKMPDVYFSYSTGECVEVVNYSGTNYTCENLPVKFHHYWVE